MKDKCHLIASVVKMDKYGDDFIVYYTSNPTRANDGEYCGGFDEDIQKTKSFDCMQAAKKKRNWLKKIYSKMEAEIYIISMSRKELFTMKLK